MATVRDVMTAELITVTPSNTVMDAAGLMFSHQAGSTLVMDGGELVGIFTERDVLRALHHAQEHADEGRSAPVSQWMTRDPVSVGPDATVGKALDTMLDGGFRHLPVADGGTVVGIVSMRDLSRSLARDR
jgi:CBS domain-containing protein